MTQTPHGTPAEATTEIPAAGEPAATGAPPAPASSVRTTHATDGFFGTIRDWGIGRDTSNRWVGGVCSGIARRLDVDPLLIRAAALLLILFGGVGLAAYLLAWLLLPDNDGRILGEEAVHRGNAGGIALIVAVALLVTGGTLVSDGGPYWVGGWVVPVAVIAFILWRRRSAGPAPAAPGDAAPPPPYAGQPNPYAAPAAPTAAVPNPHLAAPTQAPFAHAPTEEMSMSTSYAPPAPGANNPVPPPAPPTPPAYQRPLSPPPPPAPRRRRPGAFMGLVTLGAAVVAYGIGYLLDGPTGFAGSPGVLGLICALTMTSLIALGLGLRARAGGAATLLTLLLALMTPAAAMTDYVTAAHGGTGSRTWTPATSNAEASPLQLGAGDSTLDVSLLATGTTAGTVYAEQGVGTMTLEVPAGVPTLVIGNVGVGNIDSSAFPSSERVTENSGVGQSANIRSGEGTPKITIHARLGIGTIKITEK